MPLSALDESGHPVDWWFIYKVPQLGAGAQNDAATGYEYVYYDATIDANPNPALRVVSKSPYRLDQGNGALNKTLDSIFQNPASTTGWILYNDEYPDDLNKTDDGNLGHTKGVIAFDLASNTALWLLHSWPKFADPNAKQAPTPIYGQTYLCLSLSMDTARKIAAQMAVHQEPQVYDPRLPAGLDAADPLYLLTQPLNPNPQADSNVIDLATQAGMQFMVIAKNRQWNQDFWNGLVGPTLKADMNVETWIRGPIPPVADTDGIHKTFDVKYINMGPLGAHWAWPETSDHAKWGITTTPAWICVGDINRMVSQRKRGGGTIAFQNTNLWQALSRTDLMLAPPGMTRTQAHAHVMATHLPKSAAQAPPAAGPAASE